MSLEKGVGIVVFDGAEELDFVGPWEVFCMATRHLEERRVWLLAESLEPVTCAKGLRVLPDRTLAEAPELDVLLVPGGRGVRRELNNDELLAWLADRARTTPWTTSVCTGSGLLVRAGIAAGKRVTTHWTWVEELRALGAHEVLEVTRYVRDGTVVTAAGVSAGIDMSLWLVGEILGVEAARETQRQMEYDPEPPYGPTPASGASPLADPPDNLSPPTSPLEHPMSKKNKAVVEALEVLLADSYTLYLKTHSYHWNVKGPMFSTLHTMFEVQYTELALAVDEIAERIRALGAPSPGSYSQFMKIARVEEDATVPKATDMIKHLAADQTTVADAAREVVRAAAAAGDDASGDLGVRRIELHEKSAWMLSSHLE